MVVQMIKYLIRGLKPWKNNQKLKLVTHHWGANGIKDLTFINMLMSLVKKNGIARFIYLY